MLAAEAGFLVWLEAFGVVFAAEARVPLGLQPGLKFSFVDLFHHRRTMVMLTVTAPAPVVVLAIARAVVTCSNHVTRAVMRQMVVPQNCSNRSLSRDPTYCPSITSMKAYSPSPFKKNQNRQTYS